LFARQDVADPVALLHEYTAHRDTLHGGKASLFIRKNGSIPTHSWFDSKFFALLDRQFGGHSARPGGATFYASLGLTADVIQALGRWSSEAWKDYIRDNPTIRAQDLAKHGQLAFYTHDHALEYTKVIVHSMNQYLVHEYPLPVGAVTQIRMMSRGMS
jgi:hypothetical protein